jgi:hypothetical protein
VGTVNNEQGQQITRGNCGPILHDIFGVRVSAGHGIPSTCGFSTSLYIL